jgi:hypothetical protein
MTKQRMLFLPFALCSATDMFTSGAFRASYNTACGVFNQLSDDLIRLLQNFRRNFQTDTAGGSKIDGQVKFICVRHG